MKPGGESSPYTIDGNAFLLAFSRVRLGSGYPRQTAQAREQEDMTAINRDNQARGINPGTGRRQQSPPSGGRREAKKPRKTLLLTCLSAFIREL